MSLEGKVARTDFSEIRLVRNRFNLNWPRFIHNVFQYSVFCNIRLACLDLAKEPSSSLHPFLGKQKQTNKQTN